MRQFVGGIRDKTTVRDLLLSIAPDRIRAAASRLDDAELAMMERDDEPTQMRYATALAEWGDAGGYEAGGPLRRLLHRGPRASAMTAASGAK